MDDTIHNERKVTSKDLEGITNLKLLFDKLKLIIFYQLNLDNRLQKKSNAHTHIGM